MAINTFSPSTPTTAIVTITADGSSVQNGTDSNAESKVESLAVSILLVSLSVFGSIGNGLVVHVFMRKSHKVTSTIFILCLAWCDFFTCLVIMPYTVAEIQLDGHLVYDVICKLYNFLISCNVPLSAFFMVAVAVDRYFSICHPFLQAVTPRRAWISILCLCLLAFSFGFITATMTSTYHYVDHRQPGNCSSAKRDQNATHEDVISLTGESGYDWNATDFLSKGTDNFTNDHHNLDRQLRLQQQQQQQHQQHSNSTTPKAAKAGCNLSETTTVKRVYNGMCTRTQALFSSTFVTYFDYVYISSYVISFLSVFTLYFLIYISVVRRRAWRRKQKSRALLLITVVSNTANPKHKKSPKKSLDPGLDTAPPQHSNMPKTSLDPGPESTDTDPPQHNNMPKTSLDPGPESTDVELILKMAAINNGEKNIERGLTGSDVRDDETVTGSRMPGCGHQGIISPQGSGTVRDNGKELSRENRKGVTEITSSRVMGDSDVLANIRTAVMLFVVNIVFIISFLPAWLMVIKVLEYHIFVFYMYFLYNVANPVIYAFMNQSFRKELKQVFQKLPHFSRRF